MRMPRILPLLLALLSVISARGQMRHIYTDPNEDNQLLKLNFYTASEGYVAFRDFVGFSTDTGHTYSKRPITLSNVNFNGYPVNLTFGFAINGVKAFDRNNLLVYGHYGFVPAILRSIDGGATYTLIELSRYNPEQFNIGFTDLVFPENNNTGFVIDDHRVLKTNNRGTSWQTMFINPNGNLDHLEAVDNNTIFALGIDNYNNKLIKSPDGGVNWTNITLPVIPGGQLTYAYFLNATTGWLSMTGEGDNHYIYKTTNGGADWTLQNDPIAAPFSCTKMKFVNESTGYALAGYFVYKTTDSGKTWEPLPRDNNFDKFFGRHRDFQLFAPNQLWAGGDNGFLELSTNNGGSPLPKALFKTDTIGVTATGTVKLLNYSKPGYTSEWFVNSSLISTNYNTSYQHQEGKTEDTIKLVVSNGIKSDTSTRIQAINPPLIIYSFSPVMGLNGTEVIIEGNDFFNTSSVKFGGVEAAIFWVESRTRIRAIVGNGASGSVTVSTDNGKAGSKPGFTFFNPPAIDLPINISDTILCKSESILITISNTEPNVRYSLQDSINNIYGSVVSNGGTVQLFTTPLSMQGNYSIMASRTNINSSRSFSKHMFIRVEKTRSVFVAEKINLSPGENTSFSTRSFDAAQFKWIFNEDASIKNSSLPRPEGVSYNAAGQKTLTLISTSSNGCSDTAAGNAVQVIMPQAGTDSCYGITVMDSILHYQPEQFMQLNKVLVAGNGDYFLSGRGNKPVLKSMHGNGLKIPSDGTGWFAKYTKQGILKWYIHIPGGGSIYGADKDSEGNLYLIGVCHELNYLFLPGGDSIRITATNPNAPDYSNKENGFILKVDGNGRYVWHAILDDPTPIFQGYVVRGGVADHITIKDDMVLLSGRCLEKLDYIRDGQRKQLLTRPPTSIETYSQNAFVLAIKTDGTYQWHNFMSNNATNQIRDITGVAIDQHGNCLVSGYYEDAVSITDAANNTITLPGRYATTSSYLLKTDNTGRLLWHVRLKNDDNFRDVKVLSLATDNNGHAYITGSCSNYGTSSSFIILGSNGMTDTLNHGGFYMLKISPDGNLIWDVGSAYGYYGGGRTVTVRNQHVYVSGSLYANSEEAFAAVFSSTDGFNVTKSMGRSELFIAQYDTSGIIHRLSTSGPNFNTMIQSNSLVVDNNNNFLISASCWNNTATSNYFSVPLSTDSRTGVLLKINAGYCLDNNQPVANAGEDQEICKGGTTQTGSPAKANSEYRWSSRPSGFHSDQANPLVAPDQTTTYLLAVINTNGIITKDSVKITVIERPSLNAGADASVCTGTPVKLGTPATDGLQYSWTSEPGGFNSTSAQPVVTADANTIYILHVQNAAGCEASDTVSVSVYNSLSPTVSLTAETTESCNGSLVRFTAIANAGNNPSYLWKVNDGDAGSNSPQFSSTSLADGDEVTVIVSSNESCANPATATSNTIRLTVRDAPSIQINGTSTVDRYKSSRIAATVMEAGNNPHYQWQDSTSTHGWENISGGKDSTITYTPYATGDRIRCLLSGDTPCASSTPEYSNTIVFTINIPTAIDPVPAITTGVHYYPNPVTHSLTIDSLRLIDHWETFEVLSLNGNKVLQPLSLKGQLKVTVRINHLPAGYYIGIMRRRSGAPVFIRLIKQ